MRGAGLGRRVGEGGGQPDERVVADVGPVGGGLGELLQVLELGLFEVVLFTSLYLSQLFLRHLQSPRFLLLLPQFIQRRELLIIPMDLFSLPSRLNLTLHILEIFRFLFL